MAQFRRVFWLIIVVVLIALGAFLVLRYVSVDTPFAATELSATAVDVVVNEPGHKPSESELRRSAPVSVSPITPTSDTVVALPESTISQPTAGTQTPITASKATAASVKPQMTEAQARWKRLLQECNKAPRTTARLQADLEYGLAATDAWSEAFQAAFADTSQAVLLLMQSCNEFDQLPRPELMPYIAPGSNGIYTIAEIKVRAEQSMRNFWMIPTSKGASAYRDYRALQRLGVVLGPRVEGQLSRMRELVRDEILAEYESESIVLTTQIKR